MAVWFACGVVFASSAAGLLAILLWLWITRPQTSAPGPPTLPLLGNLLTVRKLPVLLDLLTEMQERYGDIFRFYAGPKLIVVVSQPEDVQKVLAGTKLRERDPYFTHFLSHVMGNGLVVSKGETWKTRRKLIEPAFYMQELENFMDKFDEGGRFFCKRLADSGGGEVDVYPILVLCTLRSVMATIFGIELDSVEPDFQEQIHLAADIVKFMGNVSEMIYKPWMAVDWIMWKTATGREVKYSATLSRSMAVRGLAKARQILACTEVRRTPLQSLLPEENPGVVLTDKEITDEIVTIASAGTETTAAAIGYAMALLGLYPEWQDKAQRELDDVFGYGGDYLRPATAAEIAKLSVIEAIVKEILRLFPPAPNVPHLVTEEIPLAGGHFVAPRGSTVLVSFYLMHRNPELFPEPNKFDPGRFMEGGSAATRKAGSFLPFGAGSRKCIGARFAILELKAMLATVLRHYRILPGSTREELEQSLLSVTMHPVKGCRVTCVPRDNIPLSSL